MSARHQYNVIAATAEMPIWTTDTAPPEPEWGVYTELGVFKPNRRSLVAPLKARHRSEEYEASHSPRPRTRKWLESKWREIGEFWFGAFQPIRDAI